MHRIKLGRPSPALLIALIALFASLGGTGYAASQVTAGASKAKPAAKPVTKAQVNKLIAGYFAAHRTELKGPVGAAGKNGDAGAKGDRGDKGEKGDTGDKGERGEIGPQGPGAISLVRTIIAGESTTLATLGPWTVTLSCSTSTPHATLTIKGAGEMWNSSGLSGVSPVISSSSTSAGLPFSVENGQHRAVTGFLTSGTTTYEVNFQMTASEPLFETCSVVGDAIPVPAAS